MSRRAPGQDISSPAPLADRLFDCRVQTTALTAGLTDADATVQSMEDASPTKWHLAHTTWFFEEFVLAPYAPGYRSVNAQYRYLFNSYYDAVGPRHPRPLRGLLSRPTWMKLLIIGNASTTRSEDCWMAHCHSQHSTRSSSAFSTSSNIRSCC